MGPNYHPPRIEVIDDWGEQGREPTTREGSEASTTRPSRTVSRVSPRIEWWTSFNDAKLDELIHRAADANLDVRRAESRVREARAQRTIVSADFYPQLNANGSYTHVRASENGVASAFGGGASGGASSGGVNVGGGASAPGSNGTSAASGSGLGEFDLYQQGFDATWELDVFGGTRRAVEAADADVQSAIEDRRDVLLSLFGEVARDYIDLRAAQRRLQIARDNLGVQRKTLSLIEEREREGLTNQFDVSRARAQVALTASQIPSLETTVSHDIHLLSILIDQRPTALGNELSSAAPVPPVPAEVPVGLPSDLLRRRPDLRRAERQLAAASARIGVATADLYPRFSLTGSLGLQSLEPGDLVERASRFYSIGPQVSLPIFDVGKRRARVSSAEARLEQATLAYRQTVLIALKDVEDALVGYGKQQERSRALADSVAADRQSLRIATELYTNGVADFLSVLDAQRTLFAAEDELATSEAATATTLVALHKSLGGGWEVHEPIAMDHAADGPQ